jgi:hypothetical protein
MVHTVDCRWYREHRSFAVSGSWSWLSDDFPPNRAWQALVFKACAHHSSESDHKVSVLGLGFTIAGLSYLVRLLGKASSCDMQTPDQQVVSEEQEV